MGWFGGFARIGDAAINAVDTNGVHYVMNVFVRSMQLIVWHGKIGFLHDCKNHASLD